MDAAFYYIPFNEQPFSATDEREIEREKYRANISFDLSSTGGKYAYGQILSLCSKGICPGKIDNRTITLLMILNAKKIYLDKQGVLKNGDRQHYIKPGQFVWLWVFIERQI